MEKCALLFHFEKQKAEKLRKAFSRLGITVKQVEPKEYELPIGLLAGLPGSFLLAGRNGDRGLPAAASAVGAGPDQEMLVFAGITGQELDRALDAMRRAGITGIPLKAMLTETNRFWNAKQLAWELKREHEAMHGGTGITND